MTFFVNCNKNIMVVSETGDIINNKLRRLDSNYDPFAMDSVRGYLYYIQKFLLKKFSMTLWKASEVGETIDRVLHMTHFNDNLFFTAGINNTFYITMVNQSGVFHHKLVEYPNISTSIMITSMP